MTVRRLCPVLTLALVGLLGLTACPHNSSNPSTAQGGLTRPGTKKPPEASLQPSPTPEPEPTPEVTRTKPPSASSPAPEQTPKTADYPYATPVPGKPGFVTSPYAPEAGIVDVRGLTQGQQALDPYTGKVFLVP